MSKNETNQTSESGSTDCSDAFYVEAPLVGKVIGTVRASSEKEAIERFTKAMFNVEFSVDKDEPYVEWIDCEEVDIRDQVNKGNVVYSPIGEAFAERE